MTSCTHGARPADKLDATMATCGIDNAEKFDCGNLNSKQLCETNFCCYNATGIPGVPDCYYPASKGPFINFDLGGVGKLAAGIR